MKIDCHQPAQLNMHSIENQKLCLRKTQQTRSLYANRVACIPNKAAKKKLVIFFMQELISFVVVTEMSLFNKQQTAFYAFVVQIAFAYRLTWVLMITWLIKGSFNGKKNGKYRKTKEVFGIIFHNAHDQFAKVLCECGCCSLSSSKCGLLVQSVATCMTLLLRLITLPIKAG